MTFRSVPKMFHLLQAHKEASFKVPHFTSAINWAIRAGFGLLKKVRPIAEPWAAIIDHSIEVGTQKALVVLRVKMDIYKERAGALTKKDCEVIGLVVGADATGEKVARDLAAIFKKSGQPSLIIKDGATNLKKGVELLGIRQSRIPIACVDDIGHCIGNALKAHYEQDPRYQRLIACMAQGARCLRQTPFAFLAPPKLRSKGRFQGLSAMTKWMHKTLEVLHSKNKGEHNEARQAVIKAMPDLMAQSSFMKEFSGTLNATAEMERILKNQGLNSKTAKACQKLISPLPARIKLKLKRWLNEHMNIQRRRPKISLIVSSDIIESLFGSFKAIIGRSPHADFGRTVLILPLLCGDHKMETFDDLIARTKLKEVSAWLKTNIPETLRSKRRSFLASTKKTAKSRNLKGLSIA